MEDIILNDGTFIYSEEGVKDYLSSLGFSIEYLRTMFSDDNKIFELEQQLKDSEIYEDALYCSKRDMVQDISEVCDDMKSYLKGKKSREYISKIEDIIEYYT
jgi:hypothetical protein